MCKELELYELMLLVTFAATETETLKKVDYYRDFLTVQGSQVLVKNHGKKLLSYPIQGFESATYIQLIYLGNGNVVENINKEIQRDISILRSVTTKLTDKSDLLSAAI